MFKEHLPALLACAFAQSKSYLRIAFAFHSVSSIGKYIVVLACPMSYRCRFSVHIAVVCVCVSVSVCKCVREREKRERKKERERERERDRLSAYVLICLCCARLGYVLASTRHSVLRASAFLFWYIWALGLLGHTDLRQRNAVHADVPFFSHYFCAFCQKLCEPLVQSWGLHTYFLFVPVGLSEKSFRSAKALFTKIFWKES